MSITGRFHRIKSADPDFQKIIQFDQDFFPKPWPIDSWATMNEEHHRLFVEIDRDKVISFALFSLVPGDDTAHLLKICLLPELRGRGGALELWNACMDQLRSLDVERIYLEVELLNLRAIRFYQKMRFMKLRIIKGFYSDGGDAVTMEALL